MLHLRLDVISKENPAVRQAAPYKLREDVDEGTNLLFRCLLLVAIRRGDARAGNALHHQG
jgi:hypothetical protein